MVRLPRVEHEEPVPVLHRGIDREGQQVAGAVERDLGDAGRATGDRLCAVEQQRVVALTHGCGRAAAAAAALAAFGAARGSGSLDRHRPQDRQTAA